ncbi:MAG: Hint domain-containing protein [Gemmobacter sp.]|nr:Hint domain-containing protein [Gemmobacter sp.]
MTAAATDWIALPHDPHPMLPAGCSSLLEQGALVIETRPGLTEPAVLVDHQVASCTFSVLADPETGVSVLHRQGRVLRRHSLPGPIAPLTTGALITYAWNTAGRAWALSVTAPDGSDSHRITGSGPIALMAHDAWGLCQPSEHQMVDWCGVRVLRSTPVGNLLVGQDTPITTPSGDRPAHSQQPGDTVLSPDGIENTLREVRSVELPCFGSLSAVALRSGPFRIRHDVLLGPQTVLRLQGDDVEYVFGQEAVLNAAQDLTDPRLAERQRDGRTAHMIGIVTAHPGLIQTGTLALHAGHAPRILRPYEAAALMSARRGTPLRAA